MKIAIVGSGISGLTAGHLLSGHHDIHLFEADSRLGGHTHTHDLDVDGESLRVDTGFIVCNDWTYPLFYRLMASVGVEFQKTDMTFSVRNDITGIEWAGTSVDTLFAQRRNLLRPRFVSMVREIFRFNKEGMAAAQTDAGELPLGEWLQSHGYSRFFQEHYVFPMGGAIWSTSSDRMRGFPAYLFFRFFRNHGMLSVSERPTWRTVSGGSDTYIPRLVSGWEDKIRLGAPVRSVRRSADGVEIQVAGAEPEHFDQVILACHSDQAMKMLSDPTDAERDILGAFPYQQNTAILHTDTRILPDRRRAWCSWNFRTLRGGVDNERVSVTYWMNRLQNFKSRHEYLVTLNHADHIDPAKIVKTIEYQHPVFTPRGSLAQNRKAEIQGVGGTWFAGAYWGFGFHEDGCRSGAEVAAALGGVKL